MKNITLTLIIAMLSAVTAAAADDAKPAASEEVWYEYDSGLGADGYDVVAYFGKDDKDGEAVRGDVRYVAEYDGKTWHFVNDDNRRAFVEEPSKYTPQYGGHCAYAASHKAQAFGDPKAWTVHNDKLYFNYSDPVRTRWEIGVNGHITRGDVYWRDTVLKKP